MLRKIISLYRKRQMRNLYKYYYKNAVIGDMFELGGRDAQLFNESGNKDRVQIGHHCRINGVLVCKTTGKIEIGNYSVIQDEAYLSCKEHIKIGHYSVIAGRSRILDNNHHRIEPEERIKHRLRVAPGGPGYPGLGNGWELADSSPVIIGNVVWVGMGCLILKGVTIGEGGMVAANSVVTKDVPPYTIVAGNPAKVVKKIEKPDYQYYKI